ncbi:MAG: tetratricopeptide repeat protein [Polyangiaceae bacterium]
MRSTNSFVSRVSTVLSPIALVSSAWLVAGCGIFAQQKDTDEMLKKQTASDQMMEANRAEIAQLRQDLEATRTRLDNALRANADASTEALSDKSKMNALAARIDEATHGIEDLRKEVSATRTEMDGRIDDLKRAQDSQPTKAPPLVIPPEKNAHLGAIESAYSQKDWGLTRNLGREFVAKYATDDKADDVLYMMGDASLREGRPAGALGEFNRILKQYPKSNVLDRTLYGMGDAYLVLKDCANAKLAFKTCESRFPKEKIGADARGKISMIDKPQSGMCTP